MLWEENSEGKLSLFIPSFKSNQWSSYGVSMTVATLPISKVATVKSHRDRKFYWDQQFIIELKFFSRCSVFSNALLSAQVDSEWS